MEMPNIQNTLRDLGRGITYHVMAYRRLSRTELMQAVAMHRTQQEASKEAEARNHDHDPHDYRTRTLSRARSVGIGRKVRREVQARVVPSTNGRESR